MKYEVIPEACRICLRKCRLFRSIFKPLDGEELAPSEKLKLVTGVIVTPGNKDNPTLPELICRSCEISLNMAYSLRTKARKSDQVIHIYCNTMNKDNIIVELNTGRKFKLSKEVTLKVVRKNHESTLPLVEPKTNDASFSDLEEHYEENYLDEEMISEEFDEKGSDGKEVTYIESQREEDIIEEHIEEHLYSSENGNDSHETNSNSATLNDEVDAKDEEEVQETRPIQLYDAAEIAKRLDASDKYEVVSWKQEGKDNSVPVFKLRVKGFEVKHTASDFICEVCGNIYRQKHRLMEHMRRHSDERRFACEICNKRFAIAEGLRRHILTHGGQKPFKCNYCTRRFYNPSARKAHEIVHSGAKPYVCNVCQRAFAYMCSLRKHMLIHENKKLYRCNYCDKEFRLQHHLKQHEETQIHKEAVAEYENSKTDHLFFQA